MVTLYSNIETMQVPFGVVQVWDCTGLDLATMTLVNPWEEISTHVVAIQSALFRRAAFGTRSRQGGVKGHTRRTLYEEATPSETGGQCCPGCGALLPLTLRRLDAIADQEHQRHAVCCGNRCQRLRKRTIISTDIIN